MPFILGMYRFRTRPRYDGEIKNFFITGFIFNTTRDGGAEEVPRDLDFPVLDFNENTSSEETTNILHGAIAP